LLAGQLAYMEDVTAAILNIKFYLGKQAILLVIAV
jgi:hypothetical protein